MSARNPAEAVERYRRSLQRVISCISDGVLSVVGQVNGGPYQPSDVLHTLLLQSGQFVPLAGADNLSIRVAFRYEIALLEEGRRRDWRVVTREYTYSIARRDHDQAVELLTFHWQPETAIGRSWPHLHVGSGIAESSQRIGTRYVHRVHVPTDLVSLASAVRMAIEELEVRPLRDDWHEILATNHAT